MLTSEAQAILHYLVSHLPFVKAGEPQGYVSYKVVHDALNLERQAETWGNSLKVQGLKDLAEWTKENKLPAISGIVISKDGLFPGKGYFSLFDRSEEDYSWWKDEVQKSIDFDWSKYVDTIVGCDLAVDLAEPKRIETTVNRIIRDTGLSVKIKKLHQYMCQICGDTVIVAGGRKYAEVHHIRPLGSPHNGPDVEENMICLCPNHHAQLDFLGIELTPQMITNVPGHQISSEYLDYHNSSLFES